MRNLRHKLIKFLAFGDPVLLNFYIQGKMVIEGKPVAYFPAKGALLEVEEYEGKAVLVPMQNIIRS